MKLNIKKMVAYGMTTGMIMAMGVAFEPASKNVNMRVGGAQVSTTENVGDVIENPWGSEFEVDKTIPDFELDDESGRGSSLTEKEKKEIKKVNKVLTKTTVKIKKAVKKKKSKKITITLKKKVLIADGYDVRVFTKKPLAKKNKKVIVRKTVKKNKKTIYVSNKKFKKYKTLYVRVRAFKYVSGKKYCTKTWSTVKKVKKN